MKIVKKIRVILACSLVLVILFTILPILDNDVVNAAAKIKLNESNIITRIGWTEQLKVVGTTKKAVWSSSDKNVVKVSKNGLITGCDIGKAVITATIGKEKLKCTVTIPKPYFISDNITLNIGDTYRNMLFYESDDSSWSSSDTKVATVDNKGVVTGVNGGTAIISIKTGGYTYQYVVKVVKTSYEIGETWIVDGQWKFTVNSVQTTADRNMFSDENPAQVVIINYSYENIGYKGRIQDLYISALHFNLMDEGKEMCDLYPATTNNPKVVPIGGKCNGAEIAYGLNNISSYVTLYVGLYDSNGVMQKVTYNLKVD